MEYRLNQALSVEEFVDLLRRSTLGERRPVDDRETMAAMVNHADLTVTAWDEGRLVGVARTLTDFRYVAYVADVAVDAAMQRRGIGRELLVRTRAALGPGCLVVLLSAPKANEFYPRIGFTRHERAWVLLPGESVR
jgi:GNAT superfamily N-acetyltransferase